MSIPLAVKVEKIVELYKSKSWQVITPRTITDVIACKLNPAGEPYKYHFVYVDGREINQNNFIQNAFSNSAIPICAYVTCVNKRSGESIYKIKCMDINRRATVIVN